MLLLADLAATSQAVGATRARREKAALLAELLRGASPEEAELAVGFLIGDLRQGRIGVGWSAVSRLQGSPDATPSPTPTLGVDDVDRLLSELQTTTGPGSQARRRLLLEDLWGRATGPEQDLLGRLLLGELRQGALEGVMVEAIAAAADVPVTVVRRAAMVAGDLRTVARLAMGGGAEALAGVGLQVGRGLLPMLASTAGTVEEALAKAGRSSVEWKLDGVRVQVHKRGDEVLVLTRNLNDATSRSAEIVEAVRALDVEQVVLDGEALGVDAGGRPAAFQDSMSRFGTDAGSARSDAPRASTVFRPFFFDVLHLDGEDLLDRPLHERQARLDAVVPDPFVVPRIVTEDPAAAAAFLQATVDVGHEGVMVKALTSTYDAGRRGAQWLKVKPVHTLDLVVLAAEWGHGRRQGWLSNLHLGARDAATGAFAMLGKTFKGLTDDLLRWQTERFLELEVSRSSGTVHVRPELVVEVAIDGVQRSTRYPAGVALRFARVRRYRPDKSAEQADTVDTVRALLPPG